MNSGYAAEGNGGEERMGNSRIQREMEKGRQGVERGSRGRQKGEDEGVKEEATETEREGLRLSCYEGQMSLGCRLKAQSRRKYHTQLLNAWRTSTSSS